MDNWLTSTFVASTGKLPRSFETKHSDKRSEFELAFGSCLTTALKMKTTEISMQLKEALIRLKKQKWNQIVKLQEGLNQKCDTFLKRKNARVSSTISKGLEDHGRKLQWLITASFPWVKKNPSDKLRLIWSREVYQFQRDAIKRRIHECKYRWLTTRWKALVTFKNRIRLCKKTSIKIWNQILWTVKTNINLCQNDG